MLFELPMLTTIDIGFSCFSSTIQLELSGILFCSWFYIDFPQLTSVQLGNYSFLTSEELILSSRTISYVIK